MNKPFILSMTLLLSLMFASGCSYYSRGPWSGRVLDADTKEPIEGAAVAAVWYYQHVGLVESNRDYYDATETTTDKNGYFNIDKYRTVHFLLFREVDDYPKIIIFKPGYGAFPSYDAEIRKSISIEYHGNSRFLGEGTIVLLPKLETKEERRRNTLSAYPGGEVPRDKVANLLKLIEIEDKETSNNP